MTARYRCSQCASQSLIWRGDIVWDYEAQRFDVTQVDDWGAFCTRCDHEVPIVKTVQYWSEMLDLAHELELEVACMLDSEPEEGDIEHMQEKIGELYDLIKKEASK